MAITQRLNTATIREIYKLFGLNKQRFTEEIGVPKSTLSGWLSKDKYYVEYLVMLCNHFRLPMESLLLRDGEEEYVDENIRQKVMPASTFAPIVYLRDRVSLRIKQSSKEGFGLDAIAEVAGFSRATLYMLKNEAGKGQKRIIGWTDFRYLAALSKAIQVPIDDFFQGSFYADRVQIPEEIVIRRRMGKSILVEKKVGQTDLEMRVASLEKELAMQRALLTKMNETLHLLASSMRGVNVLTSEEPAPYSTPAGMVSKEPDKATSALKSM